MPAPKVPPCGLRLLALDLGSSAHPQGQVPLLTGPFSALRRWGGAAGTRRTTVGEEEVAACSVEAKARARISWGLAPGRRVATDPSVPHQSQFLKRQQKALEMLNHTLAWAAELM